MKPILFSTPMVQAILAEDKTQTRRVVNPQPTKGCMPNKYAAPYQHGDILWVRETFFVEPCQDDCVGRKDENECPFHRVGDKCYGYRQQFANGWRGVNVAWKPSIHMPRAAARIFLRVTDVRVERVQDISDTNVMAEGIRCGIWEDLKDAFHALWDKLNAKRGYGWDKNPWVWCYAFERITKEEAEDGQP